jgi:hypothetical protein
MRPFGVTLLAILYGIGGVLSIATGVMLVFLLPSFSVMVPEMAFRPMFQGLSIFYLIFGAFGIVIAYGLWNLKNWARIIVIILSVLGILWSLGMVGMMLSFPNLTTMPVLTGGVVGIVIYALIIFYMLRVKNAFT